jgi:hypothetical protein
MLLNGFATNHPYIKTAIRHSRDCAMKVRCPKTLFAVLRAILRD